MKGRPASPAHPGTPGRAGLPGECTEVLVGGRDEAQVRARLDFIRARTGIAYADERDRHSSNPATVRTPSSSTDR